MLTRNILIVILLFAYFSSTSILVSMWLGYSAVLDAHALGLMCVYSGCSALGVAVFGNDKNEQNLRTQQIERPFYAYWKTVCDRSFDWWFNPSKDFL